MLKSVPIEYTKKEVEVSAFGKNSSVKNVLQEYFFMMK